MASRINRMLRVSDDELDCYLMNAVESAYHPSCTCKMGSGEDAVVDELCRLRGAEGLRIVDSSIMPSIVSGNMNAPTSASRMALAISRSGTS